MKKLISFVIGILLLWLLIGGIIFSIPESPAVVSAVAPTKSDYSLQQDTEFCNNHPKSIICENN